MLISSPFPSQRSPSSAGISGTCDSPLLGISDTCPPGTRMHQTVRKMLIGTHLTHRLQEALVAQGVLVAQDGQLIQTLEALVGQATQVGLWAQQLYLLLAPVQVENIHICK